MTSEDIKDNTSSSFKKEFIFPNTLELGMKFQNLREVHGFLVENQQGDDTQQILKHFQKYMSGASKATLTCRRCEAMVRFERSPYEQVIEVVEIRNTHVHRRKVGRSLEEADEEQDKLMTPQKRPSSKKPKEWPRGPLSQQEKLKLIEQSRAGSIHYQLRPAQTEYSKSENQNESVRQRRLSQRKSKMKPNKRDETNGSYVDLWLKTHKLPLRTAMDWGKNTAQEGPEILLMFSESMVENFYRFGDLLAINLLKDVYVVQSTLNYQVVVAAVFDSGNRPLLSAVFAVHSTTEKALRRIVTLFLSVNKKQPKSILVSDDPILRSETEYLKEIGIDYLLSASQVVARMAERFQQAKVLPARITTLRNGLLNASYARGEFEFAKASAILNEEEENAALLSRMLKNKRAMFYSKTGDAFVGLSQNALRKLSEKSYRFQNHMSLRMLFEKVVAVESMLMERATTFRNCQASLIAEFNDPALAELAECCEKDVMERFVENYVYALRACGIVGVEGAEPATNTVLVEAEGQQYKVTDSKCECQQFTKTGVACPHMICVMISKRSRSYLQLVAARWKRVEAPNSPEK